MQAPPTFSGGFGTPWPAAARPAGATRESTPPSRPPDAQASAKTSEEQVGACGGVWEPCDGVMGRSGVGRSGVERSGVGRFGTLRWGDGVEIGGGARTAFCVAAFAARRPFQALGPFTVRLYPALTSTRYPTHTTGNALSALRGLEPFAHRPPSSQGSGLPAPNPARALQPWHCDQVAGEGMLMTKHATAEWTPTLSPIPCQLLLLLLVHIAGSAATGAAELDPHLPKVHLCS